VPSVTLRDNWLRGGYPDGGTLDSARFPQWQEDYLALLAQRDLPSWGLSAKPQTTERLLRMSAAVNAQLWNASRMGQSLGISHFTANSYLDYLEGAFLVRRLRPYVASLKKRLIRSPKLYWRDSGLLHAALRARQRSTVIKRCAATEKRPGAWAIAPSTSRAVCFTPFPDVPVRVPSGPWRSLSSSTCLSTVTR